MQLNRGMEDRVEGGRFAPRQDWVEDVADGRQMCRTDYRRPRNLVEDLLRMDDGDFQEGNSGSRQVVD